MPPAAGRSIPVQQACVTVGCRCCKEARVTRGAVCQEAAPYSGPQSPGLMWQPAPAALCRSAPPYYLLTLLNQALCPNKHGGGAAHGTH
jgi:hypothetical protein